MTRSLADVRMTLNAAKLARRALRSAREDYHLALVTAREAGATDAELAEVIGTEPRYIANAIRAHRAGECGCGK